jgi:exo-1,4-beta-D-glucosaminidase
VPTVLSGTLSGSMTNPLIVRVTRRWRFLVAVTLITATLASCAQPDSDHGRARANSEVEALHRVHLQSSAAVAADGAGVSQPSFSTAGWISGTLPTTVLGALVGAGRYPDVLRSTSLSQVDTAQFRVPWWFRTEFAQHATDPAHAFVTIPGAISRAEVWLNGSRLGDVTGAYADTEFNATPFLRLGTNVLALRVDPADAGRDLTISFLDWAQHPPDNSQGIWREVVIRRDGATSLRNPFVQTALALPSMRRATLRVSVDVRNNEPSAHIVELAGSAGGIAIRKRVALGPHETRRVTFDRVVLREPRVWWPTGMGGQPLYHLDLSASVSNTIVARAESTFGVRSIGSAVTPSGDRQYSVNGVPLLIRGGGWAPDLFLREDPARWEAELQYAKDAGLNAVRLEGKLADDTFYDIADRLGILVIAGWECCSKWESWTGFLGEPWIARDRDIARASIASQALRLRTHPSVLTFLLGSDTAPPADVQQTYLDELRKAHWPDVVDLAATQTNVAPFGPSHIQWGGPYDWVPPVYWYQEGLGFSMEQGAGKSIPMLDTLKQMLSPGELDKLWRDPGAQQFHMGYTGDLATFADALARRYGTSDSLAGFAQRAHLADYEAARAQFEAYARNWTRPGRTATGTVYWMLDSPWPSLNWQLFDSALRPTAAYFGAKKANEPRHVQFSYDDRTVVVVNRTSRALHDVTVATQIFGPDGAAAWHSVHHHENVAANRDAVTVTVPRPQLPAYFVRVRLLDHTGRLLSANIYWLSASDDVPDRSHVDPSGFPWAGIGLARAADFTSLTESPAATVTARLRSDGGTSAVVTLENLSKTVALAVTATIRDPAGRPIAPIRWSDNMVTLLPREHVSLRARFARGTDPASVEVTGLNVRSR